MGVDDKKIRPSLTTSKEGLKSITYMSKQQGISFCEGGLFGTAGRF